MKILIAEDDPINYKILASILQNYGECKIVTNGVSALNSYAKAYRDKEPYDILFLDILMPEMKGDEVLGKIREFEKKQGLYKEEDQVKIVMATGVEDTDAVMGSYKKGCQYYFLKPYDKEEIIDLMESLGYAAT